MPLTRYTCNLDGFTCEESAAIAIWEHIVTVHKMEGVSKQWWEQNIKREEVFHTA